MKNVLKESAPNKRKDGSNSNHHHLKYLHGLFLTLSRLTDVERTSPGVVEVQCLIQVARGLFIPTSPQRVSTDVSIRFGKNLLRKVEVEQDDLLSDAPTPGMLVMLRKRRLVADTRSSLSRQITRRPRPLEVT